MKQLTSLRALMQERNVAALIVPGTDPHASEYLNNHWEERSFISNFTGSAGTAVITLDGGCVWTDSRYFLQASEELAISGLQLQKDGEIGTPTIEEWLISTLGAGKTVAINPSMISVAAFRSMKNRFDAANIGLYTEFDFINAVWENRPALPNSTAMVFGEDRCGRNVTDKVAELRNRLAKAGANAMLATALDDIAWCMNIRGNDVDYNPVVISYALITKDKSTLFINEGKIDSAMRAHLDAAGIATAEYDQVIPTLRSLTPDTAIVVDAAKCNYELYDAIADGVKIVELASPIFEMKSVKNSVELAGEERAMVKDGVALVRFWMWLEKMIESGEKVTELDVVNSVHNYRAEQEGFITESFGTISGYGEHGAIVHYHCTPESNIEIKPESFLLLDSGGQYLDGTTDITRTVAMGKVTDQMRRDYTLVLKGHLALGRQLFPYGTRGAQLDVIARYFLWNNELQYGHGTGHGVGHFLNVHEGPQSIRMNEVPTILEPGMVLSNEPGLYRTGEYGIRIENLVTVAEYENNTNEFGRFLRFNDLTLFPYDTKSIDTEILTEEERAQINDYHKMVYDRVSPLLSLNEAAWLKAKCAAI
ncbi:MAG: aminopeptidase P family protein [bacterium]